MNKIIRTSLSAIILLVLSACNLLGPAPAVGDTPVVRLTVQTANGATTFSAVGEVIDYNYVVTNTGSSQLAGPVIVADLPRIVICPEVSTVGNLDIYLDLNETITCTSSYTVTEADVNTGSVTNLATANVGGLSSNQSGVTLALSVPQASNVLILIKTASSQTYGQVDEAITYNYSITNTGTDPLGPAQFVISDDKLGAPLNCGPDATTLAPSQSVTCSFPYVITQADMSLTNLINTASASGAGHTSAPATASIANLTAPATPTPIETAPLAPPSNLAPGSTIQHQVAVGEWLIQIGRCYGATFAELRNANPQIANPDFILPSMIVTVPRIGSAGRIYGPPCITFHTVQSGDTWDSLAQRYNADVAVLRRVNPSGLVIGTAAKIPWNSAGSVSVTAVPATATDTVPTTTAAQRVTFPEGQTSTSLAGAVNPNQTVQYVINATQGQMLSISLSGPADSEVTLGVNGPTGLALKPQDGNLTWSTAVTTGGDHYISIASLVGDSGRAYTLTVSLTSPVAPASP